MPWRGFGATKRAPLDRLVVDVAVDCALPLEFGRRRPASLLFAGAAPGQRAGDRSSDSAAVSGPGGT
eukprot:5191217-Prymnesium_polylepis.1